MNHDYRINFTGTGSQIRRTPTILDRPADSQLRR